VLKDTLLLSTSCLSGWISIYLKIQKVSPPFLSWERLSISGCNLSQQSKGKQRKNNQTLWRDIESSYFSFLCRGEKFKSLYNIDTNKMSIAVYVAKMAKHSLQEMYVRRKRPSLFSHHTWFIQRLRDLCMLLYR
jgi:hypothetical protein